MKYFILILTAVLLVLASAASAQIPRTMNYQGVLTDEQGEPVTDGSYSLTFKMYHDSTNGTAVWNETQPVLTSSGLFNLILGNINPLNMTFDNQLWLGIAIDSGSELRPRVRLTSNAYSLSSRAVYGQSNVFPSEGNVGIGITNPSEKLEVDGKIKARGIKATGHIVSLESLADIELFLDSSNSSSVYAYFEIYKADEQILALSEDGQLSVNATIQSKLGGFIFPDGTIQRTAATTAIADTTAWGLSGNLGTDPEVNYIGTKDYKILKLRVNNREALRLIPADDSPNIAVGSRQNKISGGVNGGNISGGSYNEITDSYSVIGGGHYNTAGNKDETISLYYAVVGGGEMNEATGVHATVSGGFRNNADILGAVGGGNDNQAGDGAAVGGGGKNVASGSSSTIGGGTDNNAGGVRAVISGGNRNTASSNFAAIGGGYSNLVSGYNATIPGGFENAARGDYSFAAGTKAKANHYSSFVWSDYSSEDSTISTGPNQFLIRAAGGVGINETSPSAHLSIRAGSVDNKALLSFNDEAGDNLFHFDAFFSGANSSGNWLVLKDHWDNTIQTWRNGRVGIGTQDPQGKLDVNGAIYQRGGQLHADYVFEPDYRLESIDEHAAYMWQNKHLKAIPKAEVDDEGNEIVEVGSHRKGIVEELEKAHIYIEQLNERILVLEEKLEKLIKTYEK